PGGGGSSNCGRMARSATRPSSNSSTSSIWRSCTCGSSCPATESLTGMPSPLADGEVTAHYWRLSLTTATRGSASEDDQTSRQDSLVQLVHVQISVPLPWYRYETRSLLAKGIETSSCVEARLRRAYSPEDHAERNSG